MPARDARRFPALPAALQSANPLRLLAFFGPGAIIASVTIGSGETVFASRGGAVFGYPLVWCFLLGAILKGLQVYSSMRIMTLTGHHPVDYWAEMPGPRAWFPMVMIAVSLAVIPSMFSALPGFLATLLVSLHPLEGQSGPSTSVLASLTLVGCALLALKSSYRALEWSQTAISLLFLAFVIAAFVVVRPDLGALLRGALLVSVPDYPTWIRDAYPAIAARPPWVEVMTYVGIIGGSSTDYLAYLSFLRDKGWGLAGPRPSGTPVAPVPQPSEAEETLGRSWLRAPLVDACLSFGFVTIFSIVFLVLGAVLLAPARLVPDGAQLLTVQARFLTDLHPSLFPLYVLGIVMVFVGTIYGAIELHTRALFESSRVSFPALAGVPLPSFRRFVAVYATVTGLGLIWTGWDPVAILTPASLLGGLFACGLWCFTMLWVDARFLPPAYRMRPPLKLGVWIAALLLTAFGASAIHDYTAGLLR